MPKPLDHSSPYIYWSESQVRAILDQNPYRNRKLEFDAGINMGVRAGLKSQTSDPPDESSPLAVRQSQVEKLVDQIAVAGGDPNGRAHYAYRTHERPTDGYWGFVAQPHGERSNSAMFGIEFEEDDGTRVMVALFGPFRNLRDRRSDSDFDKGAIYGWSSSSEIGQRFLLTIGGFDPIDLHCDLDEKRSAARAALTILKGQGIIEEEGKSSAYRLESGLLARSAVSWCAHIYFWLENFEHRDGRYDLVGVGAPLWVRQESDLEVLAKVGHAVGLGHRGALSGLRGQSAESRTAEKPHARRRSILGSRRK